MAPQSEWPHTTMCLTPRTAKHCSGSDQFPQLAYPWSGLFLVKHLAERLVSRECLV